MPSLLGRGGPLQGPRLLIAFFTVLILFFYLRTPTDSPQPQTVAPVPISHDTQSPGQEKSNVPPKQQPASLGELPAEQKEEKIEKESMSDRLFDYLKGHSSHSQNSHSPIPHDEIVPPVPPLPSPAAEKPVSKDPLCANIPNLSDLLVIVRTPASDLYTHLPAHFLTDLRCVDFLLFSTVHQNIGPYTVHDALANMSDSRRSKHKDFELYDKLQKAQNAVADLSVHKEDNDHNLDRWTILPHVLSTYKMRPDKKWYVFIESDTYLSISNTLPWLNKMDHTRPLYAGAPVMIGDVELAHSGSGIILSNGAAERLVNLSVDRMDAWEEMIGNSCCGDKILAEALKEAGIRLHGSFPMIQGETPFSLDWSERHWCRPSMTWHRMTPQSIDMVWQFESAWVKKHSTGDGAEIPPMLFKDYFQTFLVPLIRQSQNRTDWDNLASSLTYTDQSRAQHSCVQYAWEPNKCRLGTVVKWGESVNSDKRMMSGWLVQRVEKFGNNVEKGKCPVDDVYIMPGLDLIEEEEVKEPVKDALQLEEEELEAKAAEEERARAEEKAREQAKAEKEAWEKAKEGFPIQVQEASSKEAEKSEAEKSKAQKSETDKSETEESGAEKSEAEKSEAEAEKLKIQKSKAEGTETGKKESDSEAKTKDPEAEKPKSEMKIVDSQSDLEEDESKASSKSKGLEISKKPEHVSEEASQNE